MEVKILSNLANISSAGRTSFDGILFVCSFVRSFVQLGRWMVDWLVGWLFGLLCHESE
jgi:hypothetical protein